MKQVEPRNQSPDMKDGLQGRILDPLWLLARQWQKGEFKADDAGSPVGAQMRVENCQITRYRAGPSTVAVPVKDYSAATAPLEALVERESITPTGGNNLRFAAQTGLAFSRILSLRGLSRYAGAFLNSFFLKPPSSAERSSLDTATLNYWEVMAKRVIDGTALYTKLAPGRQGTADVVLPGEPPFSGVAVGDRQAMVRAATDWMDWYEALFSQPKSDEAPWVRERMEYTFAVSANTSRGELALAAPEYRDGRLDWFSFNLDSTQSLGASGQGTWTTKAFLPSPVTFRGMPARRYWELEDGSVNLANIRATPQDLGRVLLVSFALEFANDWFLVPLETPIGSVSLIRWLTVTNTFGEKLLLRHATEVDGPNAPWSMFSLSPASGGISKFADAFLLPPVLGPNLEGDPVEDVLLLRDEMASMAWAVERTVESPCGQPLNRFEDFAQKQAAAARTNAGHSGSQRLVYRLGTTVPDYWIPLLPVQSGQSIRLQRGAMPGASAGSILPAKGRILDPAHALLLPDEEVPREGARVSRLYQYARWTDGSTHVWVGRRKQPGRGEGSSGLRFDIVELNP
jgi:hypothetical protein